MASKEAKHVDRAVRAHEDSADPNQLILQSGDRRNALGQFRAANDMDEQFPSSGYQAQEDKDALMASKLSSQTTQGVTPFGVLQAKDSDFEWLRRKREASEYANFSAWFATNFDKMDVTQKRLAKQLFPQFYQERLEQLDRSIALQGRLAKLKLLGIEGKDDLLLQYAAEAGFINADPLENILHPEKAKANHDQAQRQLRFSRGLLNPNRLLRGDWGVETRAKNSAQIWEGRPASGAPGLGVDGVGFSAGGTLSGSDVESWEGTASSKSQHDFIKQFL